LPSGFFVPLALTLLAPVIVNIVAFHLFLSPGNYAVVGVVLISELFLAWSYRAAFAPMLQARTSAQVPRLAPLGPKLRHLPA
jgi:putative oxidoreductase